MSDNENAASPEVQEQEPQPEQQPAVEECAQEPEPAAAQAEEPSNVEAAEAEADKTEPEPEASSSAEKPAEPEAEGTKDEGEEVVAESAEDKPAEEGEKKEEEEEPEKEEEEPIEITPEGNPYWLSSEDILAKGLPESEVENFKNFYFKHGHSLQSFYEPLKDFAVPTEFVTLSKEEIEALTVEGEVSEEQQQVLKGLEDRINAVVELYEKDGALVKINCRTGKDVYLDKNEEAFVQMIRDAVINSLEVEKQSICAYSVWKDQEYHPPGAFKRGISKIRNSFRRSRTGSAAGGRRRPKLEEEKKGDDAPKDEEPKGEEPKAAAEEGEAAAPPKEGAEAAEDTAVVQVEIETGEPGAKDAEEEAPVEPKEEAAAAEPEPEPPKEKEPAEAKEGETVAAASEEPPKEEEAAAKEEESPKEEAKKEDGGAEEGEKKEDDKPAEDGEIKPAADAEGEKKEAGVKRKSSRRKKPEEQHQFKEAKSEPLDNRVLRAFGRVLGPYYRVEDGKAALKQLRSSANIRNDLNKLKAFGGVEGVQVSLSVCRWLGQIPDQTGMLFRGFVYNNELNALSQYNDTTYFPNVVHYKDKVISGKVQQFFQDNIKEALKDLKNYVIDFFVAPEKIYVIRLSPFYTSVGACLFTWNKDARVLTKGPFEFRVVNSPKTAPDAYSSYQTWWSEMLNSVLQQRKEAQNRATSNKCVIL